ncbi:MAG: serine/threonine protein kinase [Atopobiaceae bacterium]|nr:serine/threonine protein kinase [Atopobiaceae bacterium]
MQQTERIPNPAAPPSNANEGVAARGGAQVLLGRYRVLETNTTGGFGTVNVCWDARLQRRVAIKRMPLRLGPGAPGEASTTAEALAEARTSSMLQHPNIVTMFDFERDDEFSYLVMEYVDGLNLADFLARVEGGILTFDECAHLVDSLASALAYAHENGVLHLDIKPANIMVDRSGNVKLADFGMASLASAAGYGGARGGTVGYMPPEQIEGDLVDERCDVFSLAVVIWQALTGSCPFAAKTPEDSLDLIERGPSPALSTIEPELAGRVENTLLAALDPNPAHRTASVRSFGRTLARALGDPHEGAASLRDLLTQAEPDEEPDPAEDWERLQVPIQARAPWLVTATVRILAAGAAAWIAWRVLPFVLPETQLYISTAIAGVASLLWPPLSGALGIAAITAALFAQPSQISVILALIMGLLGIMWWALAGRRSHLSGPALLAPCCTTSPLTGVCLSAFGLDPGSAFVTATGSFLLWILVSFGLRVAFAPDLLAPLLRDVFFEPRTWIIAFACGAAALIGAAISHDGRASRKLAGQLVTCLLLVTIYVLALRMENGSIAAALNTTSLVIALSLGATLCIIGALSGDGGINQKGDERA